ncbi:hypothetical protein ACTXPD_04535 [Vreelandella alkaliphila]|uniref:hypothetical protein n=1 Tax=Vreelandella alkaliphila TaxID=272774 RepID=UPI003FD8104E
MTTIASIEANQMELATQAKEVAQRTGYHEIIGARLIDCSPSTRLFVADIGGVPITQAIELTAKAWTPALEAELVKRFKGSAQLAIQHSVGGTSL